MEETDKHAGKVISIETVTVPDDGETMTRSADDKLYGPHEAWTSVKQ